MSKTKAVMVLAGAKADLARDPLDDPYVARSTERFLELARQGFRDAVDTVIELGQILAETKPRLLGHYGRWLDRLGVSPGTAHHYESLARLSAKQPGIIERWKELGPSKLYRIGDLTPEGKKALLKPRASESLQQMTDREFTEVTKQYVARKPNVTADMKAHGLRMKLKAWIFTLDGARISGIRNPDLHTGLLDDLEKLRRSATVVARDLRRGRGSARSKRA